MSDFIELDQRGGLRERSHYKFGRALVNACVFVSILGSVVSIGLVIARVCRVGLMEVDPDAFIIFGLAVASALVALFLSQLFHAFFDIADCAVKLHNKP